MLSEELATATTTATIAGNTSPALPSSPASSVWSYPNSFDGRGEGDGIVTNTFVARLRMNLTRSPSNKSATRPASFRKPPLSRTPSTLSQPAGRKLPAYGRHSNYWLFGGFSFRETLFGSDPKYTHSP